MLVSIGQIGMYWSKKAFDLDLRGRWMQTNVDRGVQE